MAATQSNGSANAAHAALNIPQSTSTINVKMIDVSTIAGIPAKTLFQPVVPGFDLINPAPSLVFLLEHASGQKALFDLGIRKDWENLDPAIVERFGTHGHKVSVEKGVSEVLDEAGIGKDNIDAVIWR